MLGFAVATYVHGAALPHGLQNGIHTFDARGQLVDFKPVNGSEVGEGNHHLERRFPGPEVGCNCQSYPRSASCIISKFVPAIKLNENDLATASNMLKKWCDTGYKVNPQGKAVFRFGSAMTFVCSYGNEQGCSANEFSEAQGFWNVRCGNKVNEGGYVYIKDWAKTYGQDVSGANPCGNLVEADPHKIAEQIGGGIFGPITKPDIPRDAEVEPEPIRT